MALFRTRTEVAAAILYAALKMARVQMAATRSVELDLPPAISLDEIVPRHDIGLARFKYGLTHAAKGLELGNVVPAGRVTVEVLVTSIAARLPPRLFQCQDADDPHLYKEKGTGKCRIDGTELVEVILR